MFAFILYLCCPVQIVALMRLDLVIKNCKQDTEAKVAPTDYYYESIYESRTRRRRSGEMCPVSRQDDLSRHEIRAVSTDALNYYDVIMEGNCSRVQASLKTCRSCYKGQ
jgi:hypothetical protein